MIEKIYSRNYSNKSNNFKKIIKIFTICTITIVTSTEIIRSINSIIDTECKNIAKVIATEVSNEETSKVLDGYKYEDFSKIQYDENGNVKLIDYNVINLNKIVSDITSAVQQGLQDRKSSSFGISLGSFSGFKILSGRGPKVNIKINNVGSLDTEVKTDFTSAGVNQTLHRIYLEITCHCLILTPYSSIEENVVNQVLLAQSVIVGEIPENYYNFNGVDSNDLLNFSN